MFMSDKWNFKISKEKNKDAKKEKQQWDWVENSICILAQFYKEVKKTIKVCL